MAEDINRPLIATIEWRKNSAGQIQPFPKNVEVSTKESMQALHWAALSMPYKGLKDKDGYFINDFERDCDGMRLQEVIARRKVYLAARGDNEMIKYVEDRSLGKPMQTNANVNVNATFSDMAKHFRFLDETEPLREAPLKVPSLIKVTRDYDVPDEDEDEEENDQDQYEDAEELTDGETIEIPEEIDYLLDPLAGF